MFRFEKSPTATDRSSRPEPFNEKGHCEGFAVAPEGSSERGPFPAGMIMRLPPQAIAATGFGGTDFAAEAVVDVIRIRV